MNMKQMNLGRTPIKISRIGLGTWAIGGGPAWGHEHESKDLEKTIKSCIDLGINVVDTAPAYNFGNSEEIVGRALKEIRDQIVLITKCGITWESQGAFFNELNGISLYRNLSPESIKKEFKASLDRLQTDYIDVYMTHWQSIPPYPTPIGETMEILNEFKAQGKIKAIGAANVTVEQLEEYAKYGGVDIVQAKYSILDREVERDLLPYCKKNHITLQAYSPLEMGLLSGTIERDYNPPKGSARANKKWFQRENMIKAIDMVEGWKNLCKKYNCTSSELAISWVLGQGDFINVLSGTTVGKHLQENVNAMEINLENEDLIKMRRHAEALEPTGL